MPTIHVERQLPTFKPRKDDRKIEQLLAKIQGVEISRYAKKEDSAKIVEILKGMLDVLAEHDRITKERIDILNKRAAQLEGIITKMQREKIDNNLTTEEEAAIELIETGKAKLRTYNSADEFLKEMRSHLEKNSGTLP